MLLSLLCRIIQKTKANIMMTSTIATRPNITLYVLDDIFKCISSFSKVSKLSFCFSCISFTFIISQLNLSIIFLDYSSYNSNNLLLFFLCNMTSATISIMIITGICLTRKLYDPLYRYLSIAIM